MSICFLTGTQIYSDVDKIVYRETRYTVRWCELIAAARWQMAIILLSQILVLRKISINEFDSKLIRSPRHFHLAKNPADTAIRMLLNKYFTWTDKNPHWSLARTPSARFAWWLWYTSLFPKPLCPSGFSDTAVTLLVFIRETFHSNLGGIIGQLVRRFFSPSLVYPRNRAFASLFQTRFYSLFIAIS